MKSLAIFGAGGHGKVVAEAAEVSGNWDKIVFFDDRFPGLAECCGYPVIGNLSDLKNNIKQFDGLIVAIGDNSVRLEVSNELTSGGARLATVVHPASTISKEATINKGSVVLAGAVINPYAEIRTCCIVNTASIVEHDCVLDEGVHLSPSGTLCGAVRVGRAAWVGAGAVVKNNLSIGENSIIGMGSVVIKDVAANTVVVGNPGRAIEGGHNQIC